MEKKLIIVVVIALGVALINGTVATMVDCYISLQESKAKINGPKLRAYQIELNDSSTIIYDGDRRVGTIPFDSCSQFDRLMLKDNE